MESVYAPVRMAPANLTQPILPGWSFNLFSVDLGASANPAVERKAVETVGSYGRQLGHVAEALEVVIEQLDLLASDLPRKKKDVLIALLSDVAAVRNLKRGSSASP